MMCVNAKEDDANVEQDMSEIGENLIQGNDTLEENIEPTTENIPVEDIIISEFNSEMYVEETQTVSATIYPTTATNQTIKYSSSNTSVAEINQLGNITAIGSGTCDILLEADDVVVSRTLTVKEKTEKISVSSKFIIIKSGQSYSLNAKAEPAKAPQTLTYKSSNETVATVSESGVITAKNIGNTSIIITNGDSTISVSVIVNSDSTQSENTNSETNLTENSTVDLLVQEIKNSEENIITVSNLSKVNSSVLKELYGTDKQLIIECDKYNIILKGADIKNAGNELDTNIDLEQKNNHQFEITINDCKSIPGKITIELKDDLEEYKYLYIEKDNNYVILNSLNTNNVEINSEGKYLLTEKKIYSFNVNVLIYIAIMLGMALIGSLIYIFSRKKYWFW
jgi:hypothetical protein